MDAPSVGGPVAYRIENGLPAVKTLLDQAPRQLGPLARRLAHLYRLGIGRVALQPAAIDALGDRGQAEQREGEIVVPLLNRLAAGAPAVGGDVGLLRRQADLREVHRGEAVRRLGNVVAEAIVGHVAQGMTERAEFPVE